MTTADVSVIIPVYNCAPLIGRALDSVLAQTRPPFEIVVVDDCSTDDLFGRLKRFKQRNIRVLKHDKNKGVSAARNTGIRLTAGKYLMFLDGDDALTPDAIERTMGAVEESRASWCITDLFRIEGDQKLIQKSAIPQQNDLLEAILADDFIVRGPLFYRDALVEVGMYDEELLAREDWDINIRMIEAQKSYCYVPEPIYCYYCVAGSITTSPSSKMLQYTDKVLRKHHRRLSVLRPELKRVYADNLWDLGRKCLYRHKRPFRAAEYALQALYRERSISRALRALSKRLGPA